MVVYLKKFVGGIVFSFLLISLIWLVPKVHLPEYDSCKKSHLKFDFNIGEAVQAYAANKVTEYGDWQFKAMTVVLESPVCFSQGLIDQAQTVYQERMTTTATP